MGRGADAASNRWNTGAAPERRAAVIKTFEVTGENGVAHEVGLPCIEQRPLTQTKEKFGAAGSVLASLHESGNVNKGVEKQVGKITEGERKASDQFNAQPKEVVGMLWEKGVNHMKGEKEKKNWAKLGLASRIGKLIRCGG